MADSLRVVNLLRRFLRHWKEYSEGWKKRIVIAEKMTDRFYLHLLRERTFRDWRSTAQGIKADRHHARRLRRTAFRALRDHMRELQ